MAYNVGHVVDACKICHWVKPWFRYPLETKGKVNRGICFDCLNKAKRKADYRESISSLNVLILRTMKNKMPDLRNHLFEALEMVKSGEMQPETVNSICTLAQTIINSVKVEVEFVKAIGGVKKSEFLQIEG